MSYQEIITQINEQIQIQPVFNMALKHLEPGREIRLLIDHRLECALFFRNQRSQIELRAAANPDVEFSISTQALNVLLANKSPDLAEFGIEVIKQILLEQIRVKVCSSAWSILTGGYISIIKAAGPDFLQFLALHGISSLNKCVELIRNLKK